MFIASIPEISVSYRIACISFPHLRLGINYSADKTGGTGWWVIKIWSSIAISAIDGFISSIYFDSDRGIL